MSFNKQFREELFKEDAWINLTSEQRESVVNIAEQQLQLYIVNQQRELLNAYDEEMASKHMFFMPTPKESKEEFLESFNCV